MTLGQGAAKSSPTVLRILIGTQLRSLREAAGLTCEQAGKHVRLRDASISRMETGKVPFDRKKIKENVADLLTLYGVTDQPSRDRIWELIEASSNPGWWHVYSDVLPSWFQTYVGLEGAAEQLRLLEVQLIPGLLQTEDYMRAVFATGIGHAEEVERRVKVRLGRQHILTAEPAPRVWVILDEGAVRRIVGSTAVMRTQLEHLLWAARLPNVTLQLLPFGAVNARIAEGGAFTILRFPELPDIVYTEQLTHAAYLDKRTQVEHYAWVFDHLATTSHDPTTTITALHRIYQEVCEHGP